MNDTQHTPGPWYYSGVEESYPIRVQNNESTPVNHNHPANARLIAAAPELLYWLNLAISKDRKLRGQFNMSKARAAIAKAEGK